MQVVGIGTTWRRQVVERKTPSEGEAPWEMPRLLLHSVVSKNNRQPCLARDIGQNQSEGTTHSRQKTNSTTLVVQLYTWTIEAQNSQQVIYPRDKRVGTDNKARWRMLSPSSWSSCAQRCTHHTCKSCSQRACMCLFCAYRAVPGMYAVPNVHAPRKLSKPAMQNRVDP